MQQTENIQLNPIIESAPVEFTMDTIGWKVLFFFLLVSVLYIIYKFYLRYKSNQYRREAVVKIMEISKLLDIESPSLITQIMFQIKQTALQTYGRKQVASLEGSQWLQFLEKRAKGISFSKYQESISNAIYKGEFDKKNDFNKEGFVKTSVQWIKKHA